MSKEPTIKERADSSALEQTAPSCAPTVKKRKKWFRRKKLWIFICLAICLTAAGLIVKHRLSANQTPEVTYTEAEVSRQTITQSLSDTGTLQPADSYTVTSLVSGEILRCGFEEGDLVEEGTLLYEIDSSDASNSVTSAQLNYRQAVSAKYPSAPISGTVSEVYVKNGESVTSGTKLCSIVSSNDLIMDFLFTYTSINNFHVGEAAEIYVDSFAGSISGTVTEVSESYTVSSTGMKLSTVRVQAANPGLVTEDYTAQATIGGYDSYGSASISLGSTNTVTAAGSGTVENLKLLSGDSVTAGTTICTISSDSIDNQITSAKLNLSSANDKVDNYQITAPISGTVITKSAKVGDKIETSSSSSLAVIYDLSYLQMELAIDELDISTVSVGQAVTITADAADGTFTGYVDKVSIAGTTSGGVTTYPVTVIIEDYGDLLPGMNVNAEIVVAESEDTLTIPSEALNRGNTVLITKDSPSAANALEEQTPPDGYVYVQVETGVSSDSLIEITSGLQEGDTVAYIPQTADASDTTLAAGGMMMGGGMPSGGGGMPSGGGGMPSGGGGMPSGGGQR